MELTHILRNFLDATGKLTAFPAKRKMKLYALLYLAQKIPADTDFTERDINDILLDCHTFADPATLRRELYDYGFLDRSRGLPIIISTFIVFSFTHRFPRMM